MQATACMYGTWGDAVSRMSHVGEGHLVVVLQRIKVPGRGPGDMDCCAGAWGFGTCRKWTMNGVGESWLSLGTALVVCIHAFLRCTEHRGGDIQVRGRL